jgi:flagellar basal body rod protein FlgC
VRPRYEPGNKYAERGRVCAVSGHQPAVEQINAMTAARAYEANVVAAETTKTMMAQALRLIA